MGTSVTSQGPRFRKELKNKECESIKDLGFHVTST